MDRRKIGILGGTFDPIHYGHLLLGEAAREQFNLDRVIFMPNNLTTYKNRKEITSGDMRYQMVKMAIADNPYFTCSRLEVDKPEGTYSYDTIKQLQVMYAGDDIYFIVGGDSIISIDTWYRAPDLLKSCTILAAVRAGDDIAALDAKSKALESNYGADVRLMNFGRIDISSTDIRERIQNGRSVRYLLPENCIEFICMKGLYK